MKNMNRDLYPAVYDEIMGFIENEFALCEKSARQAGEFEGDWEYTSEDLDSIKDAIKERYGIGDEDSIMTWIKEGHRRYRIGLS